MNILRNLRGLVVFGLAFLITTSAFSQIGIDPERDVGLKVEITPDEIPTGSTGTLHVEIDLPENHHITSREWGFFFVYTDELAGVTWGIPSYPAGADYQGETVYQGLVVVTVPFSVSGDAEPGDTVNVSGAVGYQICSEGEPSYCTQPVERAFTSTIVVGQGGLKQTGSISSSDVGETLSLEERVKRALESGSLLALLWIFLGGVALSFTPCVYPVIPITIAYIGARSGGSRLKGLSLSLVFVLGLALVYSSLGVIAAATGGVFGISTQNPWVIGFVTLVFLVMGTGMLGAFEISLPSSIQTKLASKQRSGYVGALFVGGTTGLIAAPCVGPVLVALLSWVSTTGNIFFGFLYLFVFACGLGVLFIAIGTFAGVIAALPKAGQWMETVKKVFGVILIGAAFYFGKSLVSENLFLILTGLALLLLAGVLGGFSRLDPDVGFGRKLIRGLASFITLVGAFYVLLGLVKFENIGFIASSSTVSASGVSDKAAVFDRDHAGIDWIKDDEKLALERASSGNRPLLIDFWAEWCAACKELDHKTFCDPVVTRFVNSNFISLKVDGSKITDEINEIWKRHGVKGLPTVLFLSPSGDEIARFEAFRTVEQVMPLLEEVVMKTSGLPKK